MTAKEEDILSNQSYIQKGTVIDKLIKSLIVSKIDFNQLLIGDKNAIMVAARILGYGADYEFRFTNPKSGEEEIVNIGLEHHHQLKGVGKNLRDHPAVELVWKSSKQLLDQLSSWHILL